MGVWIEIHVKVNLTNRYAVTPRVGVWIEIKRILRGTVTNCVTPRVGVWIEMSICFGIAYSSWSLPAWECGLKSVY